MSESRNTLSEWLHFLLEAGIPASQAANYSMSFVENRIEKDMLGDLDKDYLKELGVTALGDIIAILKHAKKVATRAKKRAEIQVIRTAEGVKKTTPASRFVDHFLKSSGSNSSQNSPVREMEKDEDEEVVIEDEEDYMLPVAAKVQQKSKMRSERVATSSPVVTASAPRRRVAPPIVQQKDTLREEVPVPKKRRVLPEHEGGYKIKMPAGTTPKTARLAAEGKLSNRPSETAPIKVTATAAARSSRGVFGRLGSSQVPASDSSRMTREAASSQKALAQLTASNIISAQKNKYDNSISFTVTGLGKVDPENVINSFQQVTPAVKGVFGRLGGDISSSATPRRTLKRPATSTQPDDVQLIAVDATPYIGILKDSGKHSRSPVKLKLAASPVDKTGFAASRLATDNVKKRIGASSSSSLTRTISSLTASGNLRPTSTSVKKRLGGSVDSTVSSSTDQSHVLRSSRSSVQVSTKARQPVRRSQQTTAAVGVFSRLGSR